MVSSKSRNMHLFWWLQLGLTASLATVSGQTIARIAESREHFTVDYTGQIHQFSEIGPAGPGTTPRPWICYTQSTTSHTVQWQTPTGSVVPPTPPVFTQAVGDVLYQFVVDDVRLALIRGPDYNSPDGEYCCVIPTVPSQSSCVTLTTCPMLPFPANGKITYDPVTNVATHSCDPGYAPSPTGQRTCQSDNTWSGTTVTCECIMCPTLSNPENGQVTVNTRTVGGVATYTCNNGYNLTGVSMRMCTQNGVIGQWTPEEPTCPPVDCGPLNNPTNGQVMVPVTTFNNMATYSCNSGYTLNGTQTRTCQASGVWSSADPTCEALCPRETLSNGDVTYSMSGDPPPVGTVATYSCVTGYELTGNRMRTCEEGTGWTGSPPVCNIIDCGALTRPPNGQVDTSSGTTYNQVATYSCDTGYSLVGPSTRTCQDSGMWSSTAPVCQFVNCGALTHPPNGQVDTSSGTTYNQVATYSCDTGYNLVGSSTRTCQDSGMWSSTAPVCQFVNCGALTHPPNGQVDTSSGTTYNQVATYSCDTGYNLVGPSTRTCQANGMWSSTAPVCQSICDDLPNITNAVITYSPSTSPRLMDSVATYTCQLDLPLMGNAQRTCQAGRSWSGTEPYCQRVFFQLGGSSVVTRNSELLISEVGVGDGGLVCRTDHPQCCDSSTNAVWLSPNGVTISSTRGDGDFYTTRGDGYITLNRYSNTTSAAGMYCCVVPVSEGSIQLFCAVLALSEVSPPTVLLATPPSPLTAGTSIQLTCNVTVDPAVTTDFTVSLTWERVRESDSVTIATEELSRPGLTSSRSVTVSTLDRGFTCRANVSSTQSTSSQGVSTHTVSINAPPPPVVTVDVTGDFVAGSALSLLCTATHPIPLVNPPVVSWVGVVNTIDVTVTNSSSVSESSITVTFDPLRTSRGGVYMCRADYDIPEADLTSNPSTASTTVTVQIPRPVATITADLVADTYAVGLFLDLVCEVTLSPSVNSPLNLDPVWTRDGTPPDNVTQVSILPFTMSGSSQYRSSLRFSPLTREFIGNDTVYSCEVNVSAQNDTFITGTATNASITITVEDTDFNVALSPDAMVTAGSSHSLVCQGTRDPSIASAILEVEWFGSDGSPVPAAMVTGETNTTDPTFRSTLEFPSLTTSQAGEYVCRMNLTVLGTAITDRSLERRAVVRAQIPSPQVRVTVSRTATLHEGTTGLVINCVVTPDNTGVDTDTMVGPMLTGPVPADGRRVNVSDSVDGTVVTVEQAIQVLSLSDAGEYTCSVTVSSAPNSEYIIAASVTDSLTIAVSALPPPTVTIINAPPTVQAGDSLTLTCSVGVVSDLASPPTIQWTDSSGQTALTSIGSGRNLTLTFDPVRTSDADQYTCTATINIPDVDITDRSSVNITDITVAVPPPTVTVTTSEPVYHGTSHTLSCTASYDVSLVDTPVSLVFHWTGPEGPLVSSALIVISSGSSGSTLRLSPVDHPSVSSGDYTCTVTVQSNNTLVQSGSGSDSVRVTVLAAPAPVVVTGVPVRSGRCGEVVSITCSASVVDNFVTRPVITWQGPGGIVENDETLDSNFTSPGEYTCEACVTVESLGIDNCSDTTVTITSQDPGQVSELSCPRGLPSTLNVTWSPPSGQSVLSYRVQVSRYTNEVTTVPVQLEADEILSQGFTVTGPDITQEVRYLVSVEAGGGGGCGQPVTVECYTEEGIPPVVTGVEVERLNGTAMNVSWTPLNKAQARGFIQRYIITYRVSTEGRVKRQTDSVEVPADQSSVVVGGLDPALQYGVQVGAQSQGGTSEASEVVSSGGYIVQRASLFQLRLTNINNCPQWVTEDQEARISAVTQVVVLEVESRCACGFTVAHVEDASFQCFPGSDSAVTYRATIQQTPTHTPSQLIELIAQWIVEDGVARVQLVLISVDKSCQVGISSFSDAECTSVESGPAGGGVDVAVIGGVVGVVIVLIIAITIVIVVIAILMFKSRRERLSVGKMAKRELPPVTLRGVVSTGQTEPYEMMEMGHEYEDVSKFQQRGVVNPQQRGVVSPPEGGGEYEVVENTADKHESTAPTKSQDPPTQPTDTAPLPPPASQPSQPPPASQTEDKSSKDEFKFTECIAYETHTHATPTEGDPLYSN